MISPHDAFSILAEHSYVATCETVSLAQALGRISADTVIATLSAPPHDVSAMDGYAVRFDDVRDPGARLRVVGHIPAGQTFLGDLNPGEAVRLFTGSAIPTGADHIILQENVTRVGDDIHVNIRAREPSYIRQAGMDFRKGTRVIQAGERLGPLEIALAAAANHAALGVERRPRIALIASGDELVRPGGRDIDGRIVSANPYAHSALISQWGGDAFDAGLAGDSVSDITACIANAGDADIIVPIGGASVGDHDHMRDAFLAAGATLHFERVAVKPGKPTWFGTLDGTPVLGLPGNPASAIVCAHLFLRRLMGVPPMPQNKAVLSAPLEENGPRETYLRARAFLEDGQLRVHPFPRQESSLLTPFRDANVLIQRRAMADERKIGTLVDVFDLGTGPAILTPFERGSLNGAEN